MYSTVILYMTYLSKFFLVLSITVLPLAATTVPQTADEVNPIEVGSTAPDATIQNAQREALQLSQLLSKAPTVLVFYRGSWCPYCNRQLAALGEIENDILNAGYQIIALSPDRPAKIAEAIEESETAYSLYSDSSMEAAKAFGLAFQVDAASLEKRKGYANKLEQASGQNHHWLPVPAVYVIEQGGKIRYRYYNTNYRERLSSEALLEAIQ